MGPCELVNLNIHDILLALLLSLKLCNMVLWIVFYIGIFRPILSSEAPCFEELRAAISMELKSSTTSTSNVNHLVPKLKKCNEGAHALRQYFSSVANRGHNTNDHISRILKNGWYHFTIIDGICKLELKCEDDDSQNTSSKVDDQSCNSFSNSKGSKRCDHVWLQKVRGIFNKFASNKDEGFLIESDMAALVIAINPHVKFSEDSKCDISMKISDYFGQFIQPAKGLSFEGLLSSYDVGGIGDVDKDFDVLGLHLNSFGFGDTFTEAELLDLRNRARLVISTQNMYARKLKTTRTLGMYKMEHFI